MSTKFPIDESPDGVNIKLTIDETPYEVKVTDVDKTIRDQINSIVHAFELPKEYEGGSPIPYLLGEEQNEEIEILDFEDENGQELSLKDYNIMDGSHLHLLVPPIYGCEVAPFDYMNGDEQT